jgi:hypothetical protein
VDSFAGGKYLVFTSNNSAKFRFNKVRVETVTLSGIFFDPAPPPVSTMSVIKP